MSELEAGETVDEPGPRRRRRRVVGAGVVAVLVVSAAFLWFVVLRETTTPVDVEDAVGDFRQRNPTTEPSTATSDPQPLPGADWPEPGVYTYATEGSEAIDALDGREHDFPAETTITVTREGRCAAHRWRPLQERWDVTVTCPSFDGQQLHLYRSHHEFFGIGDTRDFECAPGALWYPAVTEPGYEWVAQCSAGDIHVERTGTIVGVRDFDVGGTDVEVLTYELHDEISGASNGINDRTVSVAPDTGLIVELAVVVDVQNDSPIGDVHYREQYELRLTSLTPRR